MGFVAVAEVAYVFFVRHIGFGQQQRARRQGVDHVAKQLYHHVGLRQMNARRADFFPQIGDCIEANDVGPVPDVIEQDAHHFGQHIRIGVVEVDLIGAERRPQVTNAPRGFERGEQRRASRAHHGAEIGMRIDLDEVVGIGRSSVEVGLKPRTAARHVIEHQVEHQTNVAPQGVNIVPGAQGRIDRAIVDHRKAVVRGIGKEGQQMQRVDVPRELAMD